MERKNLHKTSIGGQALIEGVMMRGINKVSMSVRLPDGSIDKESWEVKNNKKSIVYKIPVIRGIFNFVESMSLGYKCLIKSAEKAESHNPDSSDTQKSNKIKDKTKKSMSVFAVLGISLGVLISIFLFMFLPVYITDYISKIFNIGIYKGLVEGLIKILLFIGYLVVISFSKDIKRTFQYHGAEHKSIACYEAYEELTVENVKKHSRFHPRCGTSFIFIAIIISILVFSLISWENIFIRTVLKVLALPIVVGVGYEIIKIAGRYDNIFTRILSKPGLLIQRLTTKEPDDSQLEIAIESLLDVLPKSMEEDKW